MGVRMVGKNEGLKARPRPLNEGVSPASNQLTAIQEMAKFILGCKARLEPRTELIRSHEDPFPPIKKVRRKLTLTDEYHVTDLASIVRCRNRI